MTHLEDLLARWDRYSKGESETSRQVREAIRLDEEEANEFVALRPDLWSNYDILAYPYVRCTRTEQVVCTHHRCQVIRKAEHDLSAETQSGAGTRPTD